MSRLRFAPQDRTVPSIAEGEEIAPLEFEVTDEMVDFFVVGIDDRDPWYTEASPLGGRIAPPAIVTMMTLRATAAYLYGEWQPLFERPALLEYVNDAQHLQPILVGERVRVEGRCVARYEKRGRSYMDFEFEIKGEDGSLRSRLARTTILSYRDDEERGA